ncbi:MAG: NAD(P)H-hydrate epimerase, partial [Bacteroidota bacterium]
MLLAQSHQIREADRRMIDEHNFPGVLLMENAGRLATEFLRETFPTQRDWLILAGPGNNGGDGLVMARYLHLAGHTVQVILTREGDRYSGDAAINYRILAELPVPLILFGEEPLETILQDFEHEPILIDALLGTGIQAELRGPASELIRSFSKRSLQTIAIDLPSGLSADTGELINKPLKADYTLTFQAPKVCHAVYPARTYCGESVVLDIGIWPQVMDNLEIKRHWVGAEWLATQKVPRAAEGHKGSHGHVLILAGSEQYGGAAILAAEAALYSGAGLCTVMTPASLRSTLLSRLPEAIVSGQPGPVLGTAAVDPFETLLQGKAAVLIGPGMGQSPETASLLETILPWIQVPLVLDADALNLLAQHPAWWNMLPDETILTPHPGEMKRLMDLEQVPHRRLEIAERLSQDR